MRFWYSSKLWTDQISFAHLCISLHHIFAYLRISSQWILRIEHLWKSEVWCKESSTASWFLQGQRAEAHFSERIARLIQLKSQIPLKNSDMILMLIFTRRSMFDRFEDEPSWPETESFAKVLQKHGAKRESGQCSQWSLQDPCFQIFQVSGASKVVFDQRFQVVKIHRGVFERQLCFEHVLHADLQWFVMMFH